MALRMLSRLGWPWDCFKSSDAPCCTILDEYALQDRWHPSCYAWGMFPLPATWSCAMWQGAAHLWANMRVVTGHAQEDVPKQTVGGRVPSILQSILIKNGAKGSIRWPMAFSWPSQAWLHHHTQSHGALSHPNPQPKAVGPQQQVWMCEKKLFAGWKVFSLPDFKEALPVRPNNQRLKSFFSRFPTEKVSK